MKTIIIGVGAFFSILSFVYAIIEKEKKSAIFGTAVVVVTFVLAYLFPNDSAIPYDSLKFQGHHYYIYSGSGISWKEAVNNCNDRGGYIAIINNSEENEALYNYMIKRGFDQAFFGLIRMPDGSWDYLTNKTSDFRDWGYNSIGEPEPNNADDGENYAELDVNMSYGHWNDAEFGGDTHTPDGDKYKDTSAYICEWDY